MHPEYATTVNSRLFRRLRKMIVCRAERRCDRCPWHGIENETRRAHRSWKTHRRSPHKPA